MRNRSTSGNTRYVWPERPTPTPTCTVPPLPSKDPPWVPEGTTFERIRDQEDVGEVLGGVDAHVERGARGFAKNV